MAFRRIGRSDGQTPPLPHAGCCLDFAPALPERAAIRPLVENDPGVQARLATVHQRLVAWWREHSPRLADLPKRRDLNRVRAEGRWDKYRVTMIELRTERQTIERRLNTFLQTLAYQ